MRPRLAVQVCAATHKIAVLSGDGIGPEITAATLPVLTEAGRAEGEEFAYTEAPIGGAAIDATGDPYPASTEEVCKASDAVLLACIGGCGGPGVVGWGGAAGVDHAVGLGLCCCSSSLLNLLLFWAQLLYRSLLGAAGTKSDPSLLPTFPPDCPGAAAARHLAGTSGTPCPMRSARRRASSACAPHSTRSPTCAPPWCCPSWRTPPP